MGQGAVHVEWRFYVFFYFNFPFDSTLVLCRSVADYSFCLLLYLLTTLYNSSSPIHFFTTPVYRHAGKPGVEQKRTVWITCLYYSSFSSNPTRIIDNLSVVCYITIVIHHFFMRPPLQEV